MAKQEPGPRERWRTAPTISGFLPLLLGALLVFIVLFQSPTPCAAQFDSSRTHSGAFYAQTDPKQQRCHDSRGRPQRCTPGFANAAYERQVVATNTCGQQRATEYCVQTGSGSKPPCSYCDERSPHHRHPASYLTDSANQSTWWQSETIYDGIPGPRPANKQVNLTLHLGK